MRTGTTHVMRVTPWRSWGRHMRRWKCERSSHFMLKLIQNINFFILFFSGEGDLSLQLACLGGSREAFCALCEHQRFRTRHTSRNLDTPDIYSAFHRCSRCSHRTLLRDGPLPRSLQWEVWPFHGCTHEKLHRLRSLEHRRALRRLRNTRNPRLDLKFQRKKRDQLAQNHNYGIFKEEQPYYLPFQHTSKLLPARVPKTWVSFKHR